MRKAECARHPGVAALQQCATCRRTWCNGCMLRVTLDHHTSLGCPMCKTPLGPIDRTSIARATPPLLDLLARPLRLEPLLTTFAIAVPVALSFLPGVGDYLAILGFAAAVAYYFQIIDHIGRGEPGMPEPMHVIEDPRDIFWLSLRGILCIAVGAAPFLVVYFRAHEISLLWLAVGQLYMPAVLLAIVITGSTAAALWPIAWIQIASRAPLEYFFLVVLYLASIVGAFFAHGMVEVFARIPFAGTLLGLLLERLLWFTQAALVGGFLARNAEKLGWD
jgi:hypothetical protein